MNPICLLIAAVGLSTALRLDAADLGEVPLTLPGLKLVVTDIRRVNDDTAIVVVRVKADDGLADDALVGEPSAIKPPPNATEAELDDPKYSTKSYSLSPSVLMDEATGRKFSAKDLSGGMPFLGPSVLRSSLGPGSWTQMAVCFNAPHPLPPGPDGVVPEQKVTLLLAKAAKPLAGVSLPAKPAQ